MTRGSTGLAVSVGAIAWLFLSTAKATAVIPPTIREMANRVIFALVEFETQEVLKGNADKTVKHALVSETFRLARLV
jgi:hypothetical protein